MTKAKFVQSFQDVYRALRLSLLFRNNHHQNPVVLAQDIRQIKCTDFVTPCELFCYFYSPFHYHLSLLCTHPVRPCTISSFSLFV